MTKHSHIVEHRVGDSQGEWGDYLLNNRYQGFNSHVRFHRGVYMLVAKNDNKYTRAVSRKLSPNTLSVGFSEEGDLVVYTPNLTITAEYSPLMHGHGSPYRDL